MPMITAVVPHLSHLIRFFVKLFVCYLLFLLLPERSGSSFLLFLGVVLG